MLLLAFAAGCSDEPEIVVVEPTADEALYDAASPPGERLWDTNADGLLDRGEYVTLNGQAFSNWDNDRDGSLTLEEFSEEWTALGFSRPIEAFRAFDNDGSNVLRQKDLFNAEQWETWDADNSGVLEATEFGFY